MQVDQLNALREYIKASNALAIEQAFGRDTLYESIAERKAWEDFCRSLERTLSPGINNS